MLVLSNTFTNRLFVELAQLLPSRPVVIDPLGHSLSSCVGPTTDTVPVSMPPYYLIRQYKDLVGAEVLLH